MSAFCFIERIPLLTVIPLTDVLDATKTIFHLSLVKHPHGGRILESCHDFCEIGKGIIRSPFGIAGHQESGFLSQCERTHAVEMFVQTLPQVVFHDAFERCFYVDRIYQVLESAYVSHELSDKLEKTIEELQVELRKEKKVDILRRRFIAQVSHELQTPIAVLSSYVEAIADDMVEEDEKAGYYQILDEEIMKLSGMVKDLLHLSSYFPALRDFKNFRISSPIITSNYNISRTCLGAR